MVIIEGTLDFELNRDTAVAIGKFDGMHRGHSKLLKEVLAKKSEGLSACVFTFDPSPAVFFGFSDGRELNTKEEKRKMLEDMGVDFLIEFPMNWETAGMDPEVFAREILCKRMQVKYLAAGTDLSFGAKGAGNASLLQRLAPELGFEVETIEKVYLHGQEVSSTWLRASVEHGDMEAAYELLGMPYMVTGEVVSGNRIGRTLGFPTINLWPEEGKCLPPCGVYFSKVLWDGQIYPAISNVGYKPTVTEEKKLGIETYIYDFDRMIYGEGVEVYLCEFYRQERRFESLEALKEQLDADIKAGKVFHRKVS